MLAGTKLKLMRDLIADSSKEELIWINGYLSGLLALSPPESESIPPSKPLVNKLTIVFGTESGNSKKLASGFAAQAKSKGINAKVVSLDQYRVNDLSKEEYFLAIVSTQGDGEPPAAAKKFFDHIHLNGFKLEKMKYSVLALGDTSYPLFCKAGEDVDLQLQKLGGQRITDLQKCDTDYESDAANWFNAVLSRLTQSSAPAPALPVTGKKTSGKQIYTGTVLTNINLNDTGSSKQTHHIEIEAEEISYQPGDSIGIVPPNSPKLVEAILAETKVDPDKLVRFRNEELTVSELLLKKVNLVNLPERQVKQYASIVKQDIPAMNMSLYDLLKIYPAKDALQFDEVIAILEPITPRLYSISSSPEAHSGEVHITVSRDRFCVNDEWKFGLCSDFLTQVPENDQIQFYVHKNNRFRLPAEDKDLIMIGPGTGIAPFRSFLAERDATGASGKNWLFFGDQHFSTDFLYQTEIQNWVETGVLSRINVAFSRDQKEKVYVQHKMLKWGRDLFEWIESGASIYICGAREPMSADVEAALLRIIGEHGSKTPEQAREYLDELAASDRYLKDVY